MSALSFHYSSFLQSAQRPSSLHSPSLSNSIHSAFSASSSSPNSVSPSPLCSVASTRPASHNSVRRTRSLSPAIRNEAENVAGAGAAILHTHTHSQLSQSQQSSKHSARPWTASHAHHRHQSSIQTPASTQTAASALPSAQWILSHSPLPSAALPSGVEVSPTSAQESNAGRTLDRPSSCNGISRMTHHSSLSMSQLPRAKSNPLTSLSSSSYSSPSSPPSATTSLLLSASLSSPLLGSRSPSSPVSTSTPCAAQLLDLPANAQRFGSLAPIQVRHEESEKEKSQRRKEGRRKERKLKEEERREKLRGRSRSKGRRQRRRSTDTAVVRTVAITAVSLSDAVPMLAKKKCEVLEEEKILSLPPHRSPRVPSLSAVSSSSCPLSSSSAAAVVSSVHSSSNSTSSSSSSSTSFPIRSPASFLRCVLSAPSTIPAFHALLKRPEVAAEIQRISENARKEAEQWTECWKERRKEKVEEISEVKVEDEEHVQL